LLLPCLNISCFFFYLVIIVLQITLHVPFFLYCTSVRLPESFFFLKIGDYQPRIKILGKKMNIFSILLRTLYFCPEIFIVYFCRWVVRPQARNVNFRVLFFNQCIFFSCSCLSASLLSLYTVNSLYLYDDDIIKGQAYSWRGN